MKRALVTGASSGIGAAVASALAQEGVDLILLARRKERLNELKNRLLERHAIQVDICAADLRSLGELPSSLNLGTVDVLVNNSGLAKGVDKIQEGHLDHWDAMLETNVTGLLRITRQVLPHMVARGDGHVVNLGSVAGRWVYPGGAVYCATKFAVRALSEGMRMDLLGTGVRVTNIEPGMVETEFSEVRLENSEKAKAVYSGMKPLSAEDVAETVVWCLRRPAHVNVQELVLFPTDQAAIQLIQRR